MRKETLLEQFKDATPEQVIEHLWPLYQGYKINNAKCYDGLVVCDKKLAIAIEALEWYADRFEDATEDDFTLLEYEPETGKEHRAGFYARRALEKIKGDKHD